MGISNKRKKILRLTTAGSVDDGKSTLIGRLLFDTDNIAIDQLDFLRKASGNKENIDLSLITDGLKEELENKITIDVAYRYFETGGKKFILSDAPGHLEYTRNMITGASTAHAIIILINAENGLNSQTKRHSIIASILKISNVIVCINKMDLADYNKNTFESIVEEYDKLAKKIHLPNVNYVPICALNGDNVVFESKNMLWYQGETLLEKLESIDQEEATSNENTRFIVQNVFTNKESIPEKSVAAGFLASGRLSEGDQVIIYPRNIRAKIKAIISPEGDLKHTQFPQSIAIELDDQHIEISRGDIFIKFDSTALSFSASINSMVCWLSQEPMQNSKNYYLQHCGILRKIDHWNIEHKVDINSMENTHHATTLHANEVARIKFSINTPFNHESYERNKRTGSFILIDQNTNQTVAGGMII